jgi:hypothetical protein
MIAAKIIIHRHHGVIDIERQQHVLCAILLDGLFHGRRHVGKILRAAKLGSIGYSLAAQQKCNETAPNEASA